MNSRAAADLAAEAERYLAAVDVFRAEGCEPRWRLEAGVRRRRRASMQADTSELLSRRAK